jgi:hypothetical protein
MPSASSTEGEDEDTTQRLHLLVEAKNIVLNVHHYNKEIAKEEFPIKKMSIMRNLPYSTVWKIVKRGIKHRKLRCDSGVARKLNTEQHAHSVRYAIYEMLEKKIVPTLKSLKDKLISEQRIGFEFSVETLRKFLQVIGFHYKTIDRGQVIMESPRIKKWSYDYLVEIQKCREENKTIYFLDETWYDSHDVVKKGWVDGSKKCVLDVKPGKGKRIIILHAGSKFGWVPNGLLLLAKAIKDANLDYHEDMSGNLFYNWFKDTLLSNIESNSVIVLNNASYHSVMLEKIPNSNSKKCEIAEFLYKKDIFFEENYSKKQLLEVLRAFSFKKIYQIDTLAEEIGHKVIRLPPYHCCFNPIELVWATLKRNIRKNNTNSKFSVETTTLIENEVIKIDHTLWRNCINHVLKIEETYRSKFVSDLIINLSNDTDNESENE